MTNFINKTEESALLNQPKTEYPIEYRNLVILRLALKNGLRISEQVNLKWNHIDLPHRTMLIEGRGSRKNRLMCLPDRNAQLLNGWKQKQQHAWNKRSNQPDSTKKSNFVITTLRGRQVTRHYMKKMVAFTADEADIQKPVCYKTLRKTFGRNLYRKTKNIRLVQKAMGHEHLVTTMRTIEVIPPELKNTFDWNKQPETTGRDAHPVS